jgi:hypothetical protein
MILGANIPPLLLGFLWALICPDDRPWGHSRDRPSAKRSAAADGHPVLRRGLRQAIEADARPKVVAEADDGGAALARSQEAASLFPRSAATRLFSLNFLPFQVITLHSHFEHSVGNMRNIDWFLRLG